MHEELALVVGGAPSVDASVSHRGLERRGVPEVQGFRRLYVVVTVDQDRGRAATGPAPLAQDHGVPRRFGDLCGQSRLDQLVPKPDGCGAGVVVVLGSSADRGNPEALEQLFLEAGHLPLDERHVVGHDLSVLGAW